MEISSSNPVDTALRAWEEITSSYTILKTNTTSHRSKGRTARAPLDRSRKVCSKRLSIAIGTQAAGSSDYLTENHRTWHPTEQTLVIPTPCPPCKKDPAWERMTLPRCTRGHNATTQTRHPPTTLSQQLIQDHLPRLWFRTIHTSLILDSSQRRM